MRQTRTSAQPARTLLSRLQAPQTLLRPIHITGSKGKGTVAALITAALLRTPFAAAAVGTYASPHVERVNERILLNGRPIPDDDLAVALNQTLVARDAPPVVQDATWFDVMSVAALVAFRRAKTRWAVVEVGMGGRLDSTNIHSAPVSVVTNVHLEHAEIIGPTLADIAHEKAGIIAPGADVVLGLSEPDPLAHIFRAEADSHSPPARLHFHPRASDATIFDHNLAMARAAIAAVAAQENVPGSAEELLPRAVAEAALSGLPARQERFAVAVSAQQADVSVPVLLDGAHVPDSVTAVLKERDAARSLVVLLGVGKEKDVVGICRAVHAARPQHVFASMTGPETPYMPAGELAKVLKGCGESVVTEVAEARVAFEEAVRVAYKYDGEVVVIGSLHFAGKLRPELRRRQLLHQTSKNDAARRVLQTS